MPTTTLTVRLPSELKVKLGALSKHMRRAKSYLAAEAIADYVAKELEIVQGIEQGLDDVRTGRLVSHDDVMDEMDSIIKKSATARNIE